MGLRSKFSARTRTSFSRNTNSSQILSHFSFTELKNFIRAHGVSADIKRAILCPCIKEDTGQPSINCGVCRSSGWAYLQGDTEKTAPCGKPLKVIMGGRQNLKKFNRIGGYSQTGRTNAVFFNYMPASGDLVSPKVDIEIINDEFHKRGHLYSNGKTSEFLLMEKVIIVEGIFTVSIDKTSIVEYIQGTDFLMNGRKIEWIGGANSPALGESYAVRYQAVPQYVVMEASPSFHVEHDDDEPQRIKEDIDKPIVYDVELTRLDKVLQGRHYEQSP